MSWRSSSAALARGVELGDLVVDDLDIRALGAAEGEVRVAGDAFDLGHSVAESDLDTERDVICP